MKQNFPITFSKRNEFSTNDFRFIEVTIDVMHTGANANKTRFTKSVIEKAIPSICNTPILGYVVNECDDSAKDFKGHEHALRITDTDVKYVYAGQAYGVIPESCNPRWITKDDGTGEDREYLQVDGLIWTKFNDPIDIFARDKQKNHSVEITEMVCGDFDDKKNVAVLDFKFDGCCILSTTDPFIRPAMKGSCVTANFSVDDVASQIRNRLYEYQAIQKDYFAEKNENLSDTEKGDKTPMNDNEMNQTATSECEIQEIETTEEVANATDQVTEEMSSANEMTEDTTEHIEAVDPVEEFSVENPINESVENIEPPATEYILTHTQLWDEASQILGEFKYPSPWDPEYMVNRYWMNDIQGEEVIVVDSLSNNAIVGIPYSMNGDNIILDFENSKRKKVTYEDWDTGEVMPGMVAAFAVYNDQMTSVCSHLAEIKASYEDIKPKFEAYQQAEAEAAATAEKEKRNALFAIMDEKLNGNAEYAAIKEDKNLSYSELEIKCYALIGRQSAEFSYVPNKNNTSTVRFGVGGTQNEPVSAYGGLIERYCANK